MCACDAIVVRPEQPTQNWCDTKNREVVARDEQAFTFGRLTPEREIGAEIPMPCQSQGGTLEPFEIAKERVAEDRVSATAIARRSRARLRTWRGDVDDLLRRRYRQTTQQQAFEDREDGGVDPDAERERQHGDRRHERSTGE